MPCEYNNAFCSHFPRKMMGFGPRSGYSDQILILILICWMKEKHPNIRRKVIKVIKKFKIGEYRR